MLDFCRQARHHLAPTDFGTRQGDAATTGIWVLFSFRRIHCSLLGLRRILCSTLCCSRVMRRIMPMHAKWNTIRRWYSILLVFFLFSSPSLRYYMYHSSCVMATSPHFETNWITLDWNCPLSLHRMGVASAIVSIHPLFSCSMWVVREIRSRSVTSVEFTYSRRSVSINKPGAPRRRSVKGQ